MLPHQTAWQSSPQPCLCYSCFYKYLHACSLLEISGSDIDAKMSSKRYIPIVFASFFFSFSLSLSFFPLFYFSTRTSLTAPNCLWDIIYSGEMECGSFDERFLVPRRLTSPTLCPFNLQSNDCLLHCNPFFGSLLWWSNSVEIRRFFSPERINKNDHLTDEFNSLRFWIISTLRISLLQNI